MTQKIISKSEFIELAKTMNCNQVAKFYGISDATAKKLARRFAVEFVKYVPKGRPPVKIVD